MLKDNPSSYIVPTDAPTQKLSPRKVKEIGPMASGTACDLISPDLGSTMCVGPSGECLNLRSPNLKVLPNSLVHYPNVKNLNEWFRKGTLLKRNRTMVSEAIKW